MEYETNYNGSVYEFIESNHVVVYVNGKEWGSPQGDRFFRSLLSDIRKLKEENKQLKEFVEGNEYDLTPEFRKSFPDGFK